jgi:hypothetical protein
MSSYYKGYDNLPEMLEAVQIMREFKKIHNVIITDFLVLLSITEELKSIEEKFDAMYRACLTKFFTLIETDIYSLTKLEVYDNFDDKRDRFVEEFKEAFKKTGKTSKKEEIVKKYFDSKLQGLIELKNKRNHLVHPKGIEHIYKASEVDFLTLKNAFANYDKFINDLMKFFL